MKITYEPHNFRAGTLKLIALCNAIIVDYAGQGFDLTLRQLYYQMVARDHIPNNQRSYKRMGSMISNARRAGLIDWKSIVDRTRNVKMLGRWDHPNQVLKAALNAYHRDRWYGQDYRVEAWIEKDALIGVIGPVCDELDIPHFACRGYVSDSEMWAAGQRMRMQISAGQTPIVLHLGDHDPSGIDMTRDIKDRLRLFARRGIRVERIALNMDQIEQYGPPPNPAKTTDSRYEQYIMEYGDDSWELDALEPSVLVELIKKHAGGYIDGVAWIAVVDLENSHVEAMAEAFEGIEF